MFPGEIPVQTENFPSSFKKYPAPIVTAIPPGKVAAVPVTGSRPAPLAAQAVQHGVQKSVQRGLAALIAACDQIDAFFQRKTSLIHFSEIFHVQFSDDHDLFPVSSKASSP